MPWGISLAGHLTRAEMCWFDAVKTAEAADSIRPGCSAIMNSNLKTAWTAEMSRARTAYAAHEHALAVHHLERAHILGQRFFLTHWSTHWWMLKLGFRRSDRREIRGQIVRLAAVIPGYIFGWVPKGNTGGADVSAIKPMAIPKDLEPLLQDYSVSRDVIVRILILGPLTALALFVLIR